MGPFFILILLIACGEKKSIEPGITSRSALIEIKGEPLKTEEVRQLFDQEGDSQVALATIQSIQASVDARADSLARIKQLLEDPERLKRIVKIVRQQMRSQSK